jgi:hypothetical protein
MSDELNVVNFTNVDNEPFEGMWGGEITIIKAGETKQFPKFLAEHFCKHLVNKILIRGGQDWSDKVQREPLEQRILGGASVRIEAEEIEVKEPEVFAEAPKEEPKEEPAPKKKGGRPKKVK